MKVSVSYRLSYDICIELEVSCILSVSSTVLSPYPVLTCPALSIERRSRKALQRASSEVVQVKQLLHLARDFVHYRGVVQVAPIKRIFLFRSWYSLLIEISGSSLLIESLPQTKKEMMTMTMQRSMSNDDEDDDTVAMHGGYDMEHSFNTSTSVSSYNSDTGCNDDNSYSDQPNISERKSQRLFAQDAILQAVHAAEIYGLSDSYVNRYMPSSTGELRRRRNSSCSSSHEHGLGQGVVARDTRAAAVPSTPLPTYHSASTPSSPSSSSRPFLSFSTGPVRRALDERLVGTSRSIDMHLVRSVEIGKSSIRSSSQQGLSSNYCSMHVEVRVLYTTDARDATVGHSNAVTSRDSICKSDANTSSSSIFITPHRHTCNTSHRAANTRVNSCSNNRSPAWDYDCDVLQRDDGEKKREEKLESVWFKLPVVPVHEESERELQRINSSSSGVLHLQRFLLILLCVNDSIEVYSRKRKSSAKVFHRSSEEIRHYITSLLHSTHSSSSRSTDVIASRVAALDYSVVDRAPSPSISSPSTSTMIMYQQISRSRSTSPKGSSASTFTSRLPSPMHGYNTSSGGPLLQGGASQSYCMSSSLSALTSIESLMGATSQQQQQQSMSASSSSSSSSSSHYSSFLSVASQSTTPGAVVVMNSMRGQALSTQYEDQDNDPTASSSNCISHDQLLSNTTNVRQWLQVARRYSEGCDPSVAAEDSAEEDATTIADAPDDKGIVNPTSPPATRTGIEESRISSAPSSSPSSSSSMMQRGYWKYKSFSDCRPPSSSPTSSPTRRSMTDRKTSSSSSSVQHHPFHLDRRSRAGTLLPTADVYERKGGAIELDADAASYCCDSVAAFQAMYQRIYSGGDHTMGSVTAAPYLRPFLELEPLIICDGNDRDGDDDDRDDGSGEGDMMTSHDDDAFEDSTRPSRLPKSSSSSSNVSIQAMHRAVEECVRSPCQLKRELCNSRQRRDKIEKR